MMPQEGVMRDVVPGPCFECGTSAWRRDGRGWLCETCEGTNGKDHESAPPDLGGDEKLVTLGSRQYRVVEPS